MRHQNGVVRGRRIKVRLLRRGLMEAEGEGVGPAVVGGVAERVASLLLVEE